MSAMKLLLRLTLSGCAVAIGGLVYGVLAVGVPYQDPIPAQAAAERRSVALSDLAIGGGAGMMVVGLVGMASIGASRSVKRIPAPDHRMRRTRGHRRPTHSHRRNGIAKSSRGKVSR